MTQQSERRKWLELIKQSINCVIFVVGVSEYNQAFESLAKDKFFDEKTVILFFNKYDLFTEKLPKNPVNKYFNDWPEKKDPSNEGEVLNFFYEKYNEKLKQYKADLLAPLYRHTVLMIFLSQFPMIWLMEILEIWEFCKFYFISLKNHYVLEKMRNKYRYFFPLIGRCSFVRIFTLLVFKYFLIVRFLLKTYLQDILGNFDRTARTIQTA
ncbi:G-protein alpha subunit [Reticulomyxa filosa]|uniref:G-protein alpha subunit n=1 Tax=Reticulomyxa filosa TaxID=46433 RepID=X6NEC6_RETFI|nr:G-protein alpha subunit [Reticulomyxa filosa]|eukprot:ETO24680.1 G-protein alpha subunit [Reticulomyxa filosa]